MHRSSLSKLLRSAGERRQKRLDLRHSQLLWRLWGVHHYAEDENVSYDIEWLGLGPEDALLIAEAAPQLGALETLNLSGNRLGAVGAGVLAAALVHLGSLQELNLAENGIEDDGAKAIGEHAIDCCTLTKLDLTSNRIGSEGARALLDGAQHWGFLRSLKLGNNEIGPEGATALAASLRYQRSLAELDLRANAIQCAGVKALVAEASHLSELKRLDLSNNEIGPAGIAALAEAGGQLKSLKTLNLSGNNLRAADLATLFAGPLGRQGLVALGLAECGVNDESVGQILKLLRNEPWRSSLKTLLLAGNPIHSVPAELLENRDAAAWRDFADELARTETKPLCEVKIMLLGERRVGKTHLRKRLFEEQTDYFNPGELQTHGIDSAKWNTRITLDGLDLPVHVRAWDFGGQTHLHSSHRLFLSDRRTLVIIVCDATRTRDENRLDYWLRMVRHETSPATPVVIVVNKCDLRDDDGDARCARRLETLDISELRSRAGMTRDTPLLVVDGVGWSSITPTDAESQRDHCAAIEKTRAAIVATIPKIPDFRTPYPQSFIDVIGWIESRGFDDDDENAAHVMRMEAFREACRRFELPHSLFQLALDTAHNIGLIHYVPARKPVRSGDTLADVAFNPEWVTVPVYRLIREGERTGARGVLSWAQIEAVLPEHEADARAETLWERLPFTAKDRIAIVDLMVANELIFLVQRGTAATKYFIPDHLEARRESGPPAGKFIWKRDFEWLPESVGGRLIGRLHQQAGREPAALWRDEITLDIGKRMRMTVRASGTCVHAAMSGCTEPEATHLLNQVEGELRAILGEPALGPPEWSPLHAGRETTRDDDPYPEYARYAVLVYNAVKSVNDREQINVNSWSDLIDWARQLVEVGETKKSEPELAAAVAEARSDPARFERYCRKAGLRACWSSRGKRKTSRSAVRWHGSQDDDDADYD